MIPLFALSLFVFVPADAPSEDPWTQVRLTVFRDPYISSEQVTTCRVRADNFGPRSWSGRALAFEVCVPAERSACARGRFGLTLEPYGHLETVVVVLGRHDRFEVRPLRAHDREEREQSERRRRGRHRKSAASGASRVSLSFGTGRGLAALSTDAAFSRRRFATMTADENPRRGRGRA
jgi:hypothetical protein